MTPIEQLAQDYIITPPEEPLDCWGLAISLFKDGWDIHIPRSPIEVGASLQEIWFEDDGADPESVSEPWDIWVFETFPPWGSNHVGILVNSSKLIHSRKQSICLDPLSYWKPHLVQILRHQSLV